MDPEQMQTGTAQRIRETCRPEDAHKIRADCIRKTCSRVKCYQKTQKRPWNEKTRGKHRNTTPEDKTR